MNSGVLLGTVVKQIEALINSIKDVKKDVKVVSSLVWLVSWMIRKAAFSRYDKTRKTKVLNKWKLRCVNVTIAYHNASPVGRWQRLSKKEAYHFRAGIWTTRIRV